MILDSIRNNELIIRENERYRLSLTLSYKNVHYDNLSIIAISKYDKILHYRSLQAILMSNILEFRLLHRWSARGNHGLHVNRHHRYRSIWDNSSFLRDLEFKR